MSVVLKRIAQLALALCALMPLIAAAHGNHKQPLKAAASAAGAIAVAPSHCPDDGGPGCGGHGSPGLRAGGVGMIDAPPGARASPQASAPSPIGKRAGWGRGEKSGGGGFFKKKKNKTENNR